MSAIAIDGKKLAQEYNLSTHARANSFTLRHGHSPDFSLVVIGNDEHSIRFVKSKVKLADSLGIYAVFHHIDDALSLDDIKNKIDGIVRDSHAVLIQLPLPNHLSECKNEILQRIPLEKDVDALNEYYLRELQGSKPINFENDILPCTPLGILFLIQYARKSLGFNVDLSGLRATVLGQSSLVGMPTALLLRKCGMSVDICNSQTTQADRIRYLENSDIVVSAVGKKGLVLADYLKKRPDRKSVV